MSMKEKVVIIAGAAAGIGTATARLLNGERELTI
jgi:NADP-dependent 3-hydroxy acid dehydrogenase YdfG